MPDREFCWLFDGVTTTSFVFRVAESEKLDGSIYIFHQNAAGPLQGRSMWGNKGRNITPTAFGDDISPKFQETALLCDAVGSPKLFWGAGLAPEA